MAARGRAQAPLPRKTTLCCRSLALIGFNFFHLPKRLSLLLSPRVRASWFSSRLARRESNSLDIPFLALAFT